MSIWKPAPIKPFSRVAGAGRGIQLYGKLPAPAFPDGRFQFAMGDIGEPPPAPGGQREYNMPYIVGMGRRGVAPDPCHTSFRQIAFDRRDTDFNGYDLTPQLRQQDILARDQSPGLPMPDLSQIYLLPDDGSQS